MIRRWASPLLLALLALCACGPVRLVSAYDEILDRGATELHTEFVVFGARMIRLSGTPAGAYDANTEFYEEAEGNIVTLRLRARSQEKNEITSKMIDELDQDLERLRKLHEMEKERGLRKVIATPMIQAIERDCETIIKLELAKRRGETRASN